MAALVDRVRKVVRELGMDQPLVLPSVGFTSSFFLPVPWLKPMLHVASNASPKMDYALHEIGHYHMHTHLGDGIPLEEFSDLFGNPDKWYPLFFLGDWENDYDDDPRFISKYAQVHPAEDYAETFVEAWKEIKSGRTRYYGNATLNKKVRTVKRWILQTMR